MQKITEIAERVSGYFRLISCGKTITLEPTDGDETISKAKKLFNAWIDPDFQNYGTNVRGQKTEKTNVEVYELIKDGDYRKIFGSLSEDPKTLCFTQSQIIQFVKNYREWLHPNHWTFVLFEAKGELFVAEVSLYLDGTLWVDVDRFSDECVWSAEYRHRIVVPQLTA